MPPDFNAQHTEINAAHAKVMEQIRLLQKMSELRFAIDTNDTSLVAELIEFPGLLQIMQYTILSEVACRGYSDMMKVLLKIDLLRIKVTERGNYPLKMAAQHGRLNIVILLLEYPEVEQAITTDDCFPLQISIQKGYIDIVDRLLQIQAVVDFIKNNPNILHLAVEHNQGIIIHKLLQILGDHFTREVLQDALNLALKKDHLLIAFQFIKLLWPEGIAKVPAEYKSKITNVSHTMMEDMSNLAGICLNPAPILNLFPLDVCRIIATFTVGSDLVQEIPRLFIPLYMCLPDKNYIPLLQDDVIRPIEAITAERAQRNP